MKNFFKAFFPFLLIDLLTFAVFPFLTVFTLIPVAAHTVNAGRAAAGRPPGKILRLGIFLYYFMLALVLYVLFRIMFPYHTIVVAAACAAALIAVGLKKIQPLLAAGAVMNLLIVLFFMMVIPAKVTPELVQRLRDEKFVKPVYLYMGSYDDYDPHAFKTYNGVRSITSNQDESLYYFTAKGDGPKGEFFSLFLVDPRDPEHVRKWSNHRIFDAELTADGSGLLATDYNDGRLYLLNPKTLEPVRSAETFPRPMFIIVDSVFDRAFVLHEIGGLFIQYSLPDLKEKSRKLTVSGPVDFAVDWNSGEMYTANWLFPFMLSEIDIFKATIMRVKFPLSFSGSGIDLDDSRNRVYVANTVSGRILAVDRDTFKTVGKIKTPPGVRPVLVDEKRKLIYAGNMLSPYLHVYDFDHRPVGKVFIGGDCRALYLTPATNKLLAGSAFGVLEIDVDALAGSKPAGEKR